VSGVARSKLSLNLGDGRAPASCAPRKVAGIGAEFDLDVFVSHSSPTLEELPEGADVRKRPLGPAPTGKWANPGSELLGKFPKY